MNQKETDKLDEIVSLLNSDAGDKAVGKAYDEYKIMTKNNY